MSENHKSPLKRPNTPLKNAIQATMLLNVVDNQRFNHASENRTDQQLGLEYNGQIVYQNLSRSEFYAKFALLNKDAALYDKNFRKLADTLFLEKWKLQKPNLLISISGSSSHFQMRPKLRSIFRRGIAKAAKISKAWILTGGLHAGVAKHVGKAMHDYSAWSILVNLTLAYI